MKYNISEIEMSHEFPISIALCQTILIETSVNIEFNLLTIFCLISKNQYFSNIEISVSVGLDKALAGIKFLKSIFLDSIQKSNEIRK